MNVSVEQQKQLLQQLKERAAIVHDVATPADPLAVFVLDKLNEMMRMLVECRDALPGITITQARLRGISLSLADRLETVIEPWAVGKDKPGSF